MVINLIILNFVVFVLDAIFGQGPSDIGLASDFLSLQEGDIARPWMWWRLLTYGFAHGGPQHLIGNMIGLFFFGQAVESFYGAKKFLWMYLTALVACSVIWLGATVLAPADRPRILLGASGAVVAAVIVFCLNFPHQKVRMLLMPFVGIPAWVIGVLYVGADLVGFFGHQHSAASGTVAYGVHLTGAAYAYLFFRTRWELSEILTPGWFRGAVQSIAAPKPKLRVHDPDSGDKGDRRDVQLERKADEVLKKLHAQGESSLSSRERKILEEYSRRLKQKNR